MKRDYKSKNSTIIRKTIEIMKIVSDNSRESEKLMKYVLAEMESILLTIETWEIVFFFFRQIRNPFSSMENFS